MEIKEYNGNIKLLKLPKTAFLCSRKVPATVVLKCYDWAIEQREKGNCIISGFQSQIEKDILHYLLKGQQPIIIALARGIKQKPEPDFQHAIDKGRLFGLTHFEGGVLGNLEKIMPDFAKYDSDIAYTHNKTRNFYMSVDNGLSKKDKNYQRVHVFFKCELDLKKKGKTNHYFSSIVDISKTLQEHHEDILHSLEEHLEPLPIDQQIIVEPLKVEA